MNSDGMKNGVMAEKRCCPKCIHHTFETAPISQYYFDAELYIYSIVPFAFTTSALSNASAFSLITA